MGEQNWPKPKGPHGLTTNQKDFGHQINRLAGIYSSAVIIASHNDPSVFHNATGGLLKIGRQTFLVTNAHVMKFYRELKAQHGDVDFAFGGLTFVPEVISESRDDDIDLAIIDASPLKFPEPKPGYWDGANEIPTGLLRPYVAPKWPLAPPKKGEATITVGYPAKYRERLSAWDTEFAAFPLLGHFIDYVSNRQFMIPFNRSTLITSDFDPDNPMVFETALEGMSGSPVFALHRGLYQLELVGFVHTYGAGLDVLYCSRADLVTENGAIVVPAK